MEGWDGMAIDIYAGVRYGASYSAKSWSLPCSSKENSRLYKKFKDLKTKYEDDDTNLIQLDKGKLYHNEVIIDEFNLENQIF